MSLGTPTGSARIACVASAEPPDPPRPAIPSRRPSAWRRSTTSAAPRAIGFDGSASVAVGRQRSQRRRRPRAATSCRVTCGSICGSPRMPASTSTTSTPCSLEAIAEVARTRGPSCRACRGGRRSPRGGTLYSVCSTRVTPRKRCCSSGSVWSAVGRRLGEDPPRHHDELTLGDGRRDAEVLLDRGAGSIPSATSVFSVSIRPSTIVGASPSDGSSMMRSFGFVSSARPIASICCSPPESCVPLVFAGARRGGGTARRPCSIVQRPPPFEL